MLDMLLTAALHAAQLAFLLLVWLLSTAGIVAVHRLYRLRRRKALKPRSPPAAR